MNNITIRKADPTDILALQNIAKETFLEAYSAKNTEEDMKQYLTERFSIEQLVSELNNPLSEFYFALSTETVVGYLKLNKGKSQAELKEQNTIEIERIYVLKTFQGNSIGQLLCDTAIQIAQKEGADYIWLGVWEENHNAISFYRKKGFIEFDKRIFKLGNDEQTDFMMKKDLT